MALNNQKLIESLLFTNQGCKNIQNVLDELRNNHIEPKITLDDRWELFTLGSQSLISDSNFKKIEKIKNIVDSNKEASSQNFHKQLILIRSENVNNLYFNIDLGKNGNGDFVENDLKTIYEILSSIQKVGLKCSLIDSSIDILDDLSRWSVVVWFE